MINTNIKKDNFTASEDLAAIGWKRQDGKIVDLVEIDLIDEMEEDTFYRFWVHFLHDGKELLDIFCMRVHDGDGEDETLDRSELSKEQADELCSWAKNFLEENKENITKHDE